MTSYLFLFGAIVFEVTGTMLLPLSDNFTKPYPTLGLIVSYIISFYCLTFAVKSIPLAIVYATWSGMGIFIIAVMSYFFYGQVLRWPAIAGLMMIISGIVIVNIYYSH